MKRLAPLFFIFLCAWTHGGGSGGSPVTAAATIPAPSFMTQSRPAGQITLNKRSTFAPLVSIYDRGDGVLINASNDIPAISWSLQGSYNSTTCAITQKSSAYGTAGLIPGTCVGSNYAEPGIGQTVPTGQNGSGSFTNGFAINTPSNLASLGTGAGYTVTCSFIRYSGSISADFELYCGRTWISAGEGWQMSDGPAIMWGFAENFNDAPPGSGNYSMGAYVTTGSVASPAQATVGTYTITTGVYYEFALTCQNVSSGSADCIFYVNGIQTGTLNGNALPATNNSGETDFMFGATYHTGTTESNHSPLAQIFRSDFYPWVLNPSQIYYHYLHPWSMYKLVNTP